MNFWGTLTVILGISLGFSTAEAEVSFDPPRTWRRARIIHPGQQIWGFQSSYQKITDRYADSGKTKPLGQGYSRTLTWGQLLRNQATADARADMTAEMSARGAREEDVVATASYEVEREELGFRAEWAYGLMRRWMIGFDVPLVRRITRVSSKVDMMPDLGRRRSDMPQKIREASEQELANSGYDDIPDQEASWDWGDASLLSQIAVLERPDWQWSLQQVVRFPTARNPDLDSYIRAQDDSGQVDLGMSSLVDYRVRRWVFGTQLGYVAQLPDTMRARVSSSNQSRRVDPDVSRDLGDYFFATADGDYRMTRKLSLNMEYAYLMKAQDKFRGQSADGLDYSTFSDETSQELHQTRLGLRYEVASLGARAGVESKWLAGLGYTQPWIGRNSVDAGRASLEVISYF